MVQPASSGTVRANFACFSAMVLWATGFPAGEVLLETWGALSLSSLRMSLGAIALMIFWVSSEGLSSVLGAPWRRGVVVGGIGFGLGAILLLIGQRLSDPVMPAIAAAMMPIAGAALEVLFDKRRLHFHLVTGIALALAGGILATGMGMTGGDFGLGATLCLAAVVLFAWGTRATTRDFPELTSLGQTSITFAGALVFILAASGLALLIGYDETRIGRLDARNLVMLLIFALISSAFAQALWIRSAGQLGVLLASLHMNAVPFYVMVIVVIYFDAEWAWGQALGAALVAAGVVISQMKNS